MQPFVKRHKASGHAITQRGWVGLDVLLCSVLREKQDTAAQNDKVN